MLLISIGAIVGIAIAVLVVIIIIAIVAWAIKMYNKLVDGRNKVKNSWSQVDVQLKRRFDLIPNLVETVKGYANHESEIFTKFAEARKLYNDASSEGSVQKAAEASNQLNKLVTFTIEKYPELKADAHFSELLSTLKDTEDKIAYTRQFYNDVVLSYNNLREKFPGNIIANSFSFKEAELFKVDEASREAPSIKF